MEEIEIITYKLWVKIFSAILIVFSLIQFDTITSSMIDKIEVIGIYLFIIILVFATVLFSTFSITFTKDGFSSSYFFFFKGKNFVWQGDGQKLLLVPANFIVYASLNYKEFIFMPFLVSFMIKNFSGACRMVYKYQDTEDEGDRNTLRKWGKINETEEEYQDRLKIEHLKKQIANMKDITNSNSMKKKEKIQRSIIEMERKLKNSEYWNSLTQKE